MNRGFHAFFRQYYNLRDLLRRTDPELAGSPRSTTTRWSTPTVVGTPSAALPLTPPWNALAFALRSPTFRMRDLVRINAAPPPRWPRCPSRTSTTSSTTSTPRPS